MTGQTKNLNDSDIAEFNKTTPNVLERSHITIAGRSTQPSTQGGDYKNRYDEKQKHKKVASGLDFTQVKTSALFSQEDEREGIDESCVYDDKFVGLFAEVSQSRLK